MKTPLAQDRHRKIVGRALGYEFYTRAPDSNYVDEFVPDR